MLDNTYIDPWQFGFIIWILLPLYLFLKCTCQKCSSDIDWTRKNRRSKYLNRHWSYQIWYLFAFKLKVWLHIIIFCWVVDGSKPFFCFIPSKSRTLTKVGKNTRCTSWKNIKLFCIYLLWILIFLTVKCATVYIEYRTTIKPLFQYHHDITEILLKVALNTITLTLTPLFKYIMCGLWHKSSLSICITWSEYEPIYIKTLSLSLSNNHSLYREPCRSNL